MKHADSHSYLVKSGKELVFMKDAPVQLRYCFKVIKYDSKGEYLVFETTDRKYLGLNSKNNKCELADDSLENIMIKQQCTEESIRNILISAQLKAEMPLPPN